MPIDPMALISPVTDALGTLGSGLFEGVDPTQMLAGVTNAFASTSGPLQQAAGALDDTWQGASSTAAVAKSMEAIANGTEVGTQSDALRASLETAAADVAHARARLIAIVAEFDATIAAIGPNIIFPWGWAAAIAAANKAIASASEVMTELQASMGAEAAEVTAKGAPVDVTSAPEMASGMAGPASASGGSSSPLSTMASNAMQAGVSAATKAAESGASAASQAAMQGAQASGVAAAAPLSSAAGTARPSGAGAGAGGSGGGGGSAGGGASMPRSVASSSMVQPDTPEPATPRSATGVPSGGAGSGMMGGAPYAPMAGHGAGANGAPNSHTAAAFLHTAEQGGEIVGDLGTAAPPVLGAADPNDHPDIELRI